MRMDTMKSNSLTLSHYKKTYLLYKYATGKIKGKLIHEKKRPLNYCGKEVIDAVPMQIIMKNNIVEGKPFLAGRLGANELNFLIEALMIHNGLKKEVNPNILASMENNAGFFNKDEASIQCFAELMADCLKNCNILGAWYNNFEDVAIRLFLSNEAVLSIRGIYDFWKYEHPFTEGLAKKKVLIVHPFKETIVSQYKYREKLFPGKDYLPSFDLRVVKAIQSIGRSSNNEEDWFNNLDIMYKECMEEDFDVALIGCGAYGFPLAMKLNQHQKTAIHMGGVLQILFGIMGRRWEDDTELRRFRNKYWVRASEAEKPKSANDVEDACYW